MECGVVVNVVRVGWVKVGDQLHASHVCSPAALLPFDVVPLHARDRANGSSKMGAFDPPILFEKGKYIGRGSLPPVTSGADLQRPTRAVRPPTDRRTVRVRADSQTKYPGRHP